MNRVTTILAGTLLGALLLALVFTLGYVSHGDGGAGSGPQQTQRTIDVTGTEGGVDFGTIQEIVDILRAEYYGRENLDERALYEAAIDGLLDSLADTGTFYIDPTSYQLSIGPSGTFEGIGATVNQEGEFIIIVSPFVGSPAETAGLRPGDLILAVDGESIEGWPLDRAVLRIRGPKGSDVTLTVRHVDGATEEYTITRDEVKIDSVTTTPPGGVLRDVQGNEVTDVAYMRIAEFSRTTPGEVEAVAREAEASGKQGLIIDLRVNPGGLLQETVDTADLFLNEGVILIEVDRDDQETFYRARPGGAALNIPIVILQDGLSASWFPA